MLHADAARLLAEADYPPSVKQTILLALRGGRPGKQTCLACARLQPTADGSEAGPQRRGVALYRQRQRVYTQQA